MTTISIIVAMGTNRVIGTGGQLPWDLPSDMDNFMTTTMGHPIIMGRKTHESIGEALPGRTNIILSRRKDTYSPGCVVVNSPESAMMLARLSEGGDEEDGEIFVIGGGTIFEEFLPRADKLYITRIDHDFSGDVHFPEVDEDVWDLKSEDPWVVDQRNPYAHSFLIFERKNE